MTDDLDAPPGWRFSVSPGWSLDDGGQEDFLPLLNRIGHVLLPEYFYLAAGTPGMWAPDGQVPGQDDYILFLHFTTRLGQLELVEIRSAGKDLTVALEEFRKAVPVRLWKPIAIREMTDFLARFDENDGWRSEREIPALADEWVDIIRGHRAKSMAKPKRRSRITDEHLQKVAAAYMAADVLGLPPTRSVSQQFETSHSTAAKWVGAARRRGFIPPVDQMQQAHRRARLEKELAEAEAALSHAKAEEDRDGWRLQVDGIKRDIENLAGD